MNEQSKNGTVGLEIVFHSMGMPFNGATLERESLGGSETAAYYQARELARRGHHVTMFTSHREGGMFDGVNYVWHGEVSAQTPLGHQFEFYAGSTPHDALIIQRHPIAFHKPWQAKVCVHQMHDLALHRMKAQIGAGMWQTSLVTCVSEWHKQQVLGVYPLKPEAVAVIPNGVDPALYAPYENGQLQLANRTSTLIAPRRQRVGDVEFIELSQHEFVMLYQSRPERGLEHLVRPGGIMARLYENGCTHIRLVVVGYENTTAPMAEYYAQLRAWGEALPNVTFFGALPKPMLARLQMACDLLVYPTEFEEVSCITAMEAMHAGLPMMTSAHGALTETCADTGTILIPLKDGRADEDAFVERISALTPNQLGELAEHQQRAATRYTWSAVAAQLESVLLERLKPTTDTAVLRSAMQLSDVAFAERLLHRGRASNPIGSAVRNEIEHFYGRIRSPQSTVEMYAEHSARYYDAHEETVIGEDVTQTTRFRGTFSPIDDFVRANPGRELRILDFGCAHGHYLVPLAKAFPAHRFTGIDISARAVGAARKWIAREGLDNATVLHDGGMVALNGHLDTFDLILAGEVVEHVWDAVGLLNKLKACLVPGGRLVITTPHGPWESSDIVRARTERQHVHHFEKADIREMCTAFSYQLLYAPASPHRNGMMMGSWVWAVDCGGAPGAFAAPDYTRKLARAAGRQTIGAHLIVKDAENTLRRCVLSFIDWVDEVVIGVDPNTTDRTIQTIDRLQKEYPHLAFRWAMLDAPVLDSGFAAARNAVMDEGHSDWVLWLDADEEVHHPWNLQRVARASAIDGYCYPQIHYSVDPSQVLTTDYPCRMFRRSAGARFYGVVHEHPEIEPGKAMPQAVMRPDVKFVHCGYTDEETRRARYHRNLPLLKRDIVENPTRGLNKYLWLRDIAQGIVFEAERGTHALGTSRAQSIAEGMSLFEDMLASDGTPLKMVIDALPYYTLLNEAAGCGFEAEVRMAVRHPAAPDLSTTTETKAIFATREHYLALMTRIAKETTKHYDSPHL